MKLDYDLSKVSSRERLKPKPNSALYWQRLSPSVHVGFRPTADGSPGAWVAKVWDPEARKERQKRLGAYADRTPSDRFGAAKRDAETFAREIEAGGQPEALLVTVADACRQYAETHPEATDRFRRYVYADPLGPITLAKLRRKHLKEWRKRLVERPALVSRSKKSEPVFRPRAPSSVNRDLAPLRAALNSVLPHGQPKTEAAWQEGLKALENATRRRTLYLPREQRRAFLAAVVEEAAPFMSVLAQMPVRPGALALLNAGDFDPNTGELSIHDDKGAKHDRRIEVSDALLPLFREQAKDKLPLAPLFMRANGERWNKDSWGDVVEAASAAAGLPQATVANTFRHSVITDMVVTGADLFHIAKIAGTSVEMIQKHYGHLRQSAVREALAAVAL